MNKRMLIAVLILAVSLMSGAGYLGFRSSRAQSQATPEAPPTLPVSTCDIQQSVTAPGSLTNTHQATIEMPSNGRLEEIYVNPGDPIKAGQALARLADRDQFEAAVAAAELDLLQAKSDLEALQQSAAEQAASAQLELVSAEKNLADAQKKRTRLDYPRASDELIVENARTDYELAKAAEKEAQKAYNKVAHKKLTDPGRAQALKALLDAKQKTDRLFAIMNWYLLEPGESEIAAAEAELAVAQAAYQKAAANWEKVKDGPDPLSVELGQAKVADAQASLDTARKALENTELRAPFDGVVLEVKMAAGATAPAGTPVIVLDDPQALEIETTVIEEDLPQVAAGQQAQVFFDALPEVEVTGRVSRILPRRAPGDRPLYYVYISLDRVPGQLVAGMTADASIIIDQRQDVLCLPRSLVRAASDGSATVWVWWNGQEEQRAVQVGLRGDVNVEILSGLKEGELVVAR